MNDHKRKNNINPEWNSRNIRPRPVKGKEKERNNETVDKNETNIGSRRDQDELITINKNDGIK